MPVEDLAFKAVDGGDVIQRGKDLRLSLKTCEAIAVSGQRWWQDVDRDLAFQLRVGGPIHLAHPACTDLGGDFVDAEARSRREAGERNGPPDAPKRPPPPAGCYHQHVDKTVGHRRTDVHDPAALQRTLAAVRGTGVLVPRGVYRFTSFEEADAWMTRMMARSHVSHNSRISSASPAP